MLKNPKRSGKGPEGAGVCPARPGRAARVSGGAGERPARAEATCGSWGEPLRSCFFTASSPVGDAHVIAGHPHMPITWQVRMSEPGSGRASQSLWPQKSTEGWRGGCSYRKAAHTSQRKTKHRHQRKKKKAHSLKGPARGCQQRSQRLLLRPGNSDSAASPRQSRDSGERTRHKPIEPSERAMPEEEESPSLLAGVENTMRCHTASRTQSAVVGASRTHWGQTGLIQTLASARTAVSPGHLAQHRAHSRCSVHVQ